MYQCTSEGWREGGFIFLFEKKKHGLLYEFFPLPGTLVHWYTGTLVHWYTGTRVHWYTGTLVHWYTGTLVHWYTGTLVHWYTGTLVHCYTATLVHCYHCYTATLLHRFSFPLALCIVHSATLHTLYCIYRSLDVYTNADIYR